MSIVVEDADNDSVILDFWTGKIFHDEFTYFDRKLRKPGLC
jgi:hypothetical protein